MPSNPAMTRDRPFVGRTAELAALEAALARAAAGAPTVALVSGEAGIGKTRLVLELAERAEAQDVIALLGSCVELSVPAPYLPVAQALRRVVRALPTDRLEGIAAGRRTELGLLVPSWGRPTARRVLFHRSSRAGVCSKQFSNCWRVRHASAPCWC